jgi:hypothetical protein
MKRDLIVMFALLAFGLCLLFLAVKLGLRTPEHRAQIQRERDGSCPWDSLRPATVHFCEHRVCGWIEEPANTWSNLAFFVVGAVILRESHREPNAIQLRPLGWACQFLGIGSFAFHATGTFIFEFFDLSGMFLVSNFWLMWNVNLVRQLPVPVNRLLFAGGVATCSALLLILPSEGTVIFTVQIVAIQLIQIALLFMRRKDAVEKSAVPFALMAMFFGLSFFLWQLDINGHPLICDPHNHFFQGHSLWHLFNGCAIYSLYRHFRLFPETKLLHKGSAAH